MKEIIEKAEELSRQETADAVRPLFEFATEKGQALAEGLNADKDIVMLGTLFMDIKRKQAVAENREADHIKMGVEVARKFFENFDISEENKQKVYNCIEAHHGDVPFSCIESEISTNADCYKFLHPKGMLHFFSILGSRGQDFSLILDRAEEKLEEKWDILSLDICKEELEPHYKSFKELITKARE